MVLNKKNIKFGSVRALTKRINKLEKIKKRIKKRMRVKDSTSLRRSIRNVRESLSQLKVSRRQWRKFTKSVTIFSV